MKLPLKDAGAPNAGFVESLAGGAGIGSINIPCDCYGRDM